MNEAKTIGVATTNPNFIKPVFEGLKSRYNLKVWQPTNPNEITESNAKGLAEGVDAIFVDFAQTPLEFYAGMDIPVFVRLHRIEAYQMMQNTHPYRCLDWGNVHMIFSSEHMRDRWLDFTVGKDNLKLGSYTVNHTCMVDLDKFKYSGHRPRDNYQMCIVGRIIPKKRVYSLIQMLQHLPDWKLNIVGDIQYGVGLSEYKINCEDLAERLGISDRINFVGRIDNDKLPEFLGAQDIIVSNSNEEGTHVSVAEGMACGAYPLVNCWRGAENIYPADSVFTSETDFIEKVKSWEGLDDELKNELSDNVRYYAEEHFDEKKLVPEFMDYVLGVLG